MKHLTTFKKHLLKKTALALFASAMIAPAFAGWTVNGTQVLDPNGNKFVFRGVNHAHSWYTDRLNQSLKDIAATGANSVRIVLSNGTQWTRNNGADVTNVAVFAGGMLLGLRAVPMGSADITDAIASSFGIRRSQAERLKCVAGSAVASPADHRELIPVNGPGEGSDGQDQGVPAAPLARGADDKNRIVRAELVGVVTQQLAILAGEIGKALKGMGFSGTRAGQVVLTGGGAELAGMADFMQGALGQPVRLGRPPQLSGMPEAHHAPGFATLAGLCLYAAEDPVDIRAVGAGRGGVYRGFAKEAGAMALVGRLLRAVREYF